MKNSIISSAFHFLAIGFIICLFGAGDASGITVTNTNLSGPGSLLSALDDSADGATITFDPALGGKTIVLTAGPFSLHKNVTLDGSGLPDRVTLSGNGANRIFVISAEVNLTGLRFTRGSGTGGPASGRGGALYISGGHRLTINDCVFEDNKTDRGGGIYNADSELVLTDSVFKANNLATNIAANRGGGIFNTGSGASATVTRCRFEGNGAYQGGAILNEGGGLVIVRDSTFTGNITYSTGGAIRNGPAGSNSTIDVERCTFSRNSAGQGGAIFNQEGATVSLCTFNLNAGTSSGGAIFNDSGQMSVRDCTVTGNTAPSGKGGGLCIPNVIFTPGLITRVGNCIIAGNGDSDVDRNDTAGSFNAYISTGRNLIGTGNAASQFTAAGDIRGLAAGDIKLSPLGNFGGLVETMQPLPGSPAIDPAAGGTITGFPTDQRGFPRLADGDEDGSARVDAGAVEIQPPQRWVVTTTANSGAGSLRQAILDTLFSGIITFAPALSGQTITLASQISTGSKVIRIDASGLPGGITISGGGTVRHFQVPSRGELTLIGLRLTGGKFSAGGAVSNAGSLTIDGCTLSGNRADGPGGAVFNFGVLDISNSTLSGNSAVRGGAIYNLLADDPTATTAGSATLSQCTLSGNSSEGSGGAILTDHPDGAEPFGFGRTTLTNCTVSGNSAAKTGGVASASNEAVETVVRNCIIAGNTNGDADLVNLNAPGNLSINTFKSEGSNLIGKTNAAESFAQPGDKKDLTAADIKLAPLANYGGPTQTMHPLLDSPAVDPVGGAATSPFSTDQRGRPRVGDADGTGPVTLDIGAVEVNPTIVTTAADQLDTPTGPQTSLREAFRDGGAAGARILFDPAVFGAAQQTITLGSRLNVLSRIIIDASSLAPGLTISGGGATRLFFVDLEGRLTLKGLRLSGGNGSGGGGGAVSNFGTLTIAGCTLSGNTSLNFGGAVRNSGVMEISNSTLSGNSAVRGGAIYNLLAADPTATAAGSSTLTQCTLSGNTSAEAGGAILTDHPDGAEAFGLGRTILTDCTVSGNTAASGGGGGVASASNAAVETVVQNCIIAGNVNGDADLVNINAPGSLSINTLKSQGRNLIGDTNTAASFKVSGDWTGLTDVAIRLSPLGNYGGATETMVPLVGSPAVDPASGAYSPVSAKDQRGFPRVVDGDNNNTATADVGAVEVRRILVSTTADQSDTPAGTEISLREAIRDGTAALDRVSFDRAVFGSTAQTITLGSEIVLSNFAGIDGSSARKLTISGGGTMRHFRVAPGGNLTLSGLTLANGKADEGGAINSQGTVTIFDCSLSGNSAGYGGAIINTGMVNGPQGNLTITRSTFSGNSASATGGAVLNEATYPEGIVQLTYCTLSGNSAASGGAISGGAGRTTLTGCTVSGNTSPNGGGVFSSAGRTLVRNSIIGGNTNGDVVATNPANNNFSSLGGNFIGTGNGAGSFAQVSDRTGHTAGSLRLAPLGDYGGPTKTMMLLPYSPAIDAGVSLSIAEDTDQRGFARILGAGLDSGAYESGAADYTANGLTIFARVPVDRIGPGVTFEISTDPNFETPAITSTLAGSGVYGNLDGPRLSAQFFYPTGVAQDSMGNLFIADAGNNRIRMQSPDGVVTTIAGSGRYAMGSGPGPDAAFALPSAVAVGADDNLYVSDTYNHRICKLTRPPIPGQAWTVTTLAGNGSPGFKEGTGAGASFNYPYGLDLDAAGNVFVADALNHRIRKVTPAGIVTTFAGAGTAGFLDSPAADGARFNTPQGIVFAGPRLFVADRANNRIRQVAANGAVTTLAGSGVAGVDNNANGLLARFRSPSSLAADADGNLYVADEQNHVIRKITTAGAVLTVAGVLPKGFQDGDAATARFNAPAGLVVTIEGILVVADTENHRLRRVTIRPLSIAAVRDTDNVNGAGEQVRALLDTARLGLNPDTTYYFRYRLPDGSTQTIGQRFVVPLLPAVITGNATSVTTSAAVLNATVDPKLSVMDVHFEYSTDPDLLPPHVVTTLAGSTLSGFADGAGSAAQFNGASGIGVDGSGNVFVADRLNHRIRKITPGGVVSTYSGTGAAGFAAGGPAAQFDRPSGIAVDAAGMVFVADELNHRTRSIDPSGVVSVRGSGIAGFADGQSLSARFLFPSGVAVDASGRQYVADRQNHRIRRIEGQQVSTLAGTGSPGAVDGILVAAQFNSPRGVAVTSSGDVLIADTGNHRIRVIRGNLVFTLAGGSSEGFLDGPGPEALFSSPTGVAAGPDGFVYVADSGNHRIRRIDSNGQVSTFAGSGSAGTVDSPATGLYQLSVTSFELPQGIAIDAAGNMYVTQANRVRKIARRPLPRITIPNILGNGGRPVSAGIPEPLQSGTTYYYRATATHEYGTTFGQIRSFATPDASISVHAGDSTAAPPLFPGQTAPVDYGKTPRGSPVERKFTIENKTGVPFTVSSISVPSGYQVTGGTGVVAPGGSIGFEVKLLALTGGPAGGEIVIASTAPGQPAFTFPVTGEVLDRPVAVTLPATAVSHNGATLHARVNPKASSTVVSFEWSTDPEFDGVKVSTLAGSTPDYAEGAGKGAKFNQPRGVATDASGNVYVADYLNNRIRKITPDGTVSTYAGSDLGGHGDGPAAEARFLRPVALVFGKDGVLFVADTRNNCIRAISPAGVVSTFSGSGLAGFTDGVATAARFSRPWALAVDAAGTLYVADSNNHRIRKVAADGSVSTLAGSGVDASVNGPGNTAAFHMPTGIAVDSAGAVYVTETDSGTIRKIAPDGFTSNFAGSAAASGFLDASTPAAARFDHAAGLAIDAADTLYIADQNNRRIRRITAGGIVTTVAGAGSQGALDGAGEVAQFDVPVSVAVTPGGGLAVGDIGTSTIRKIVSAQHRREAATGLEGTVDLAVDLAVTGLTSETRWYYRTIAVNGGGTTVTSSVNFMTGAGPAPFEAWKIENFGPGAANPLISGPDANPARDGITNLVKYGLGLDPGSAVSGGLPIREISGETVTLTYTEVTTATDVDYIVEWSTDLTSWSPAGVSKTTVSENALTRIVRASLSTGGRSRFFIRLRIALKQP